MRILVTGVSGQVGGALVKHLVGHDLIGTDRTTLDLAHPEAIDRILDRLAPDLIINPAAFTAVDKAEEERELASVVNAEAPAVLARWSARKRVPFIHFSTDYVFDGTMDRPWRESDPTNPLSVYGATKLAGEHGVRAAGGDCLIVRTSWVYAANGKNFLRTIARLARERPELRIVADQIGAPTSADFIAAAIAHLLRGGLEAIRRKLARSGGLVHLTTSGEVSWYGFAGAIVEGLRNRGVQLVVERLIPIETKDYPTPARRPLNSRLCVSRVQDIFGISPPFWTEALDPELDRLAAELLNDRPPAM